MFLMGLTSLTLFLILYIVLDRTTFLPLQKLVLHASEIRHQKDLVSRLPGQKRKDEIGSLIREMNHLLDFQYESTETLENTVDDRTLELSASNSLLQAEINHHQQTQEQFSRLNEELEAIFATSRVGIMLLRGGRFLYKCNQRLAEIYGYKSPKEMVQISMEKLHLSHENFLKFGKEHYQPLQEGPQSQVEYEFRRKDGTKIWCLVSGMAMDSSSPPDLNKGVTWVVDDITKRKEEELKLAELAKMQGMFATIGGVCHELGQPVQIISAHTQILKKLHHPHPYQIMNRVRSIYEQTERMGDILKNLQSITRFETTDYVAGMQILDINKSSEDNQKSTPDEAA
jgi:PAS domain S-box-containing protein